jgi:hypothetical protein
VTGGLNYCCRCFTGKIFNLAILAFSIFWAGCSGSLSDPQEIVDQSIRVHGGEKFLKAEIEFDFRDRHYIIKRNDGIFSKERILKDAVSTTHDILTNDGFVRKINESVVALPDSMAKKYTASVNGVVYFALLPYGLNDPSVIKKFLGNSSLQGQLYYKIEVTFDGAGDKGDTFYYWIHQKMFTVDYFAYHYFEEGKWDFRFRKAINRRDVGGITFNDYINYKPKGTDWKFSDVEELFRSSALEELSRIELRNIVVR